VPTQTYRFGAGRRESHDASGFYERFPAPEISEDDHVDPPAVVDRIWTGDARAMDEHGEIADDSVALVVTSPPYYAGKEYETAIGEGHVPESYMAYVEMLHDVFAECRRKLQPGGRIAVNVANLGRKPYRSLSADVIDVLQRLGYLVRGEIVWVKGKAAGGSCAWGTFQRPGNPVLRDVTERIVVASKGRFDRAKGARDRAAADLPAVATVSADEFMDLTTDVWEFPPESATRVGHPAPFPVELPRRLIDLYTYEGELVLDPFMGAGSTAVAAVRTGRHYVGFDTEPGYVERSLARVEEERALLAREGATSRPVHIPPTPKRKAVGERPAPADGTAPAAPDPFAAVEQAVREGRKVRDVARLLLDAAGFRGVEENVKLAPGVEVPFRARDARGRDWCFDLVGAFSNGNPGLRKAETLWRALGRASVVAATGAAERLVLLTVETPPPTSPPGRALAAVTGTGPGKTVTDVIRLCHPDDQQRLTHHAQGSSPS
jgi:DNA modification methylase